MKTFQTYKKWRTKTVNCKPAYWCLQTWGRFASYSLVVGSLMIGCGPLAHAESLMDALSSTYSTNPVISAERARQRATDEEVPIARSGYRPSFGVEADGGSESRRLTTKGNRWFGDAPPTTINTSRNPWGYTVSFAQPVFRGFRTLNSIRAAEALVYAGREELRTVEITTLIDGVRAYVDVGRDLAIVRLQQNNVKVLAEQLKATKDRFSVGEVTRTDVAQAEARLSGSRTDVSIAQSNLRSSRATFEQIVGYPPGTLRKTPLRFPFLPRTLDEALAIADSENSAIVRNIYREIQSRYEVDRIRGELLPTVDLNGAYSQDWNTSEFGRKRNLGEVYGRLNFPFYQGGQVHARVRQAKQVFQQRTEEVRSARVDVRAILISAWGRYQAAQAALISGRAQVEANKIALNGVREEEKVGQRTVLDVLDAEQELLDSQVDFVRIERELVDAAYSLLAAMGRLTAADLGLKVDLYDSEQYYHEVRRKWFGKGPRLGRVDRDALHNDNARYKR